MVLQDGGDEFLRETLPIWFSESIYILLDLDVLPRTWPL